MARRRLIVAGIGALMLTACLLLGLNRLVGSDDCTSPIFLRFSPEPASLIESLIKQVGGLPKSTSDLLSLSSFPSTTKIYPVSDWRIEEVSVHRGHPLLDSIRDDDPVYGLKVDIRVQYTDGSISLLRWSTWRYGLALCPVLLGYGDGPPGKIEPLDLSSN